MIEQNKKQRSPDTKKGHERDREYDKKETDGVTSEKSSTESKPGEAAPHDTIRDAKDRWDNESPAQKGQPNRIDPEPLNKDISEEERNPDITDEELDEEDPDAHKNIK